MVGIINDEDLDRLLVMIDPQTWDPEKEKCKAATNNNSQYYKLSL